METGVKMGVVPIWLILPVEADEYSVGNSVVEPKYRNKIKSSDYRKAKSGIKKESRIRRAPGCCCRMRRG